LPEPSRKPENLQPNFMAALPPAFSIQHPASSIQYSAPVPLEICWLVLPKDAAAFDNWMLNPGC
jgi:hypothetical protein